MLRRLLSTSACATVLGLLSLLPTVTPAVIAKEARHHAQMEADGFSLWNFGERSGVAFDVWTRPAREGGGFYYFLWQGQYAAIADTAEPEVAAFFYSNIAQVNGSWLVDCLDNGSTSPQCQNPGGKPSHMRFTGPCIFPWQFAIDGSSCGGRAAITRPGNF